MSDQRTDELIIFFDTNGGSLPDEVYEIVTATKKAYPDVRLGIHCHLTAQ